MLSLYVLLHDRLQIKNWIMIKISNKEDLIYWFLAQKPSVLKCIKKGIFQVSWIKDCGLSFSQSS